MAEDGDQYWFPAKCYGWGWGLPCRWQGWLVMALYVALLPCGTLYWRPDTSVAAYLAYVFALSVLLVAVAWIKGEPPRWRWGDK